MIKFDIIDTVKVKYILSCVYSYGVSEAYNQSMNKSIFKYFESKYNIPVDEVAKVLINYMDMSIYFRNNNSIVDEDELIVCAETIRASKLLKFAITEYKRSDIYQYIIDIYFNNCKEQAVDNLLKHICVEDAFVFEPYFDNNSGILHISKSVDLNDLILGVINYQKSVGGSTMLGILEQLNLVDKFKTISTDITDTASQFISMLEFVGLRVCDILPTVINQDIFPSSKYFISSIPGVYNQYSFVDMDDVSSTFHMYEAAFIKLANENKLDSITVVNNTPTINGVTISKYLGVANA